MNDLDKKRKQLIFRAGHRGTKEMDLLLGSFANAHVPTLSEEEILQFEELLTLSDPDLYNWITGKEETPANLDSALMAKLKAHKIS